MLQLTMLFPDELLARHSIAAIWWHGHHRRAAGTHAAGNPGLQDARYPSRSRSRRETRFLAEHLTRVDNTLKNNTTRFKHNILLLKRPIFNKCIII